MGIPYDELTKESVNVFLDKIYTLLLFYGGGKGIMEVDRKTYTPFEKLNHIRNFCVRL